MGLVKLEMQQLLKVCDKNVSFNKSAKDLELDV